jgi:O-6-methylguanine DNA methyltransferase
MAGSCSALISSPNKSLQRVDSRALAAGVPIEASAGVFIAIFSEDGLVELDFPCSRRSSSRACNVPPLFPKWQEMVANAINDLLAGSKPRELPPFDWTGRSEFQQKVWRALLKIPVGHTRTYSEVAERIGMPGAARAVGNACGANPIPVLVPCHRVLAAGGKIGGFSAGLEWKQKLLAAEKVQLL